MQGKGLEGHGGRENSGVYDGYDQEENQYGDCHMEEGPRLIRIESCLSDKMHLGPLFRVFSKSYSYIFLREPQNSATFVPPICTWGQLLQYHMCLGSLFFKQYAHGVEFDFATCVYQQTQNVLCRLDHEMEPSTTWNDGTVQWSALFQERR